MWHRPLSEMLIDVFDAVVAVRTDHGRVHARSIELSVPIEVWLREVGGEPTFIADVPVWRWRTAFDQPPARLHITWETADGS
jgi:hypothetical protein